MRPSLSRPRRPLGVTILAAVFAFGAIGGLLVAAALVLGVVDVASIGLTTTGLSATSVGLGIVVYTAAAVVFAYGAWTLRRWGWLLGVLFLVGSVVSDIAGGALGWQPVPAAAAQVLVGLLVLAYWLRRSVRMAFLR